MGQPGDGGFLAKKKKEAIRTYPAIPRGPFRLEGFGCAIHDNGDGCGLRSHTSGIDVGIEDSATLKNSFFSRDESMVR